MNIPDVELVVVLGMPDTIAEFYQVGTFALLSLCWSFIIFNPKQKCKDQKMLSYCLESENCLRKALVGGVGGDFTKLNCPRSLCCTSCSAGTVPYAPTDILKPLRSQRSKRPPLVRDVAEEVVQRLEQQLKEARKGSSTSLGILGCQFVCPDPVIRQICSIVNSIKTAIRNC